MKKITLSTLIVGVAMFVLPLVGNAATFTGTVTYDDDGAPTAGVWIKFFDFDTAMGDQGITDPQGKYSFTVDDIDPGNMVYHGIEPSVFWDADWNALGYNQTWTVPESGTLEVDFVVTRCDASLSGTVLSPPSYGERITGSIFLINDQDTFWAMNFGHDDFIDQINGDYHINVKSGTYTLYYYPDLGAEGSWNEYYYDSRIVTIEEGSNALDIQIGEMSSTIEATVTLDGTPTGGIQVVAVRQDGHTEGGTNESGVASFNVKPGVTYEVTPRDSGDAIYTGAPAVLTTVDGKTSEATFAMQTSDATVNVVVKNKLGNVEDASGSAWCETDDASFSTEINNGQGTIKAVADSKSGSFDAQCYLSMADKSLGAAASEQVSVESGDSLELVFTLLEATSTITVSVEDVGGDAITGSENGSIHLWSEELGMWYEQEIGTTGEESVSVIPGTYSVNASYSDDSYVSAWDKNDTTVTVEDSSTAAADAIVQEVTGTVTGTVVDESGEPMSYGTVYCDNWDSETETGYSTTAVIEDGAFTAHIPDGDTYTCGVGVPQEMIDGGVTAPVEQEVVYETGTETLNALSFQMEQADATIDLHVDMAEGESVSSTDELDTLSCYTYSDEGGYAVGDYETGETEDLHVDSGRTWHTACTAVSGDTVYTSDPVEVEVQTAGENADASIVLESDEDQEVHAAVTTTFNANEAATINLDDGTTVDIPAYSMALNNTVTVNAFPEREVVHTGESPESTAWNLEAYDADGSIITSFLDDITINMPYNEEHATDLGVAEDELLPSYFDPIGNTWKQVDNATIDTEENVITVRTDHFTQYGVTYNTSAAGTAEEVVDDDKEEITVKKVKKLKVKKKLRKRKRATATWKKHSYVTVLKLQKWNKKKKKYKKYRTYRVKKNKKKKIMKKLKPKTKYRVRARKRRTVEGTYYYSDWTKWVKFRTKK